MKLFKSATLVTALLALPLTASADVPNVFQPGQPATAADVNQNFQALDDRISALESASALSEAALIGDYRLHLTGALYEFFDEQSQAGTIEAGAWRDFLVVGTLTLGTDGVASYAIDGELEPIMFHEGPEFLNDTDPTADGSGGETISAEWTFNTESERVELTLFTSDVDGLLVELHVSRDLNNLIGSEFLVDQFIDNNEEVTEYEIINFSATRLKN
ncbi:MAG: hypothetical protein R3296_02910 [Oleiphilaceae bacterium]|nr:hypothetical protein [Oleiphilaceae bacterium]